jgi:TPR repeat protein
LGIAYETGRGTDVDPGKAAELYRKAADQNLAEAQNNLGRLYLQGSGVPRDTREALRLFSAAAKQGNGQSYVNLAVCYLVACGSVVDPIAAYSWYLSARSSGIPIPQNLSEKLSALGEQLNEEQHQRAELDSQNWIAQHPAADPRSPRELNHVPGTAVAMDQQIPTLTDDEVLKSSWHQTPYTPQHSPIQHSVH